MKARINRRTYLGAVLFNSLLLALLARGLKALLDVFQVPEFTLLSDIVLLIILLLMLYWYAACVSAILQRLHDTPLNWKWIFIAAWFSPFVIALVFIPGRKGSNRYGAPPTAIWWRKVFYIW